MWKTNHQKVCIFRDKTNEMAFCSVRNKETNCFIENVSMKKWFAYLIKREWIVECKCICVIEERKLKRKIYVLYQRELWICIIGVSWRLDIFVSLCIEILNVEMNLRFSAGAYFKWNLWSTVKWMNYIDWIQQKALSG